MIQEKIHAHPGMGNDPEVVDALRNAYGRVKDLEKIYLINLSW